MNDSLIVVIGIGVGILLLIVFPVMTMADRADDIAQSAVEALVIEYVDQIRLDAVITADGQSKFRQNVNSTGNLYELEMEIKKLDENPGKKRIQSNIDKIDGNYYISMYTNEIEDKLNDKGYIKLNQGDTIYCSVKNVNLTTAEQFMNWLYKVRGNDTYSIVASHGGIVTGN